MALAGSVESVSTRANGRAGVYGGEHIGRSTEWREVLAANPLLTELALACEDLVRSGTIQAETWNYIDAQRLSLIAENLRTHHVKAVEGVYDPVRDVVVVAHAGGKEIIVEDVLGTGLDRVRIAHSADSRLGFQVTRDEIYEYNYYNFQKPLLHDDTEHDIVVSLSTCPVDMNLPEGHDPQGLKALAEELYYDFEENTWYIYIAKSSKKDGKNILTTYSIRMASSDEDHIRQRLIEWGHDADEVNAASLHELGRFVGKLNSHGLPIEDFIDAEVAWHDRKTERKTRKAVSFGRSDESIEAYKLFASQPELHTANRAYTEALARHVVGDVLDPQLRSYLLSSLEAQEVALKTRNVHNKPVISMDDIFSLRRDIERGRIGLELIDPTQRLMMYSHKALFQRALDVYKETGEFAQIIDADDVMGSYGNAASAEGGQATFVGVEDSDCPGTVSALSTAENAAALAAELGISIEEATRMLAQRAKTRRVANNASLAEKYGVENVFHNRECGACGKVGKVGPCGPGFCNDCDTADRNNPGYIMRLYTRRQAELAKRAQVNSAGEQESDESGSSSETFVIEGERYAYRQVVGVGGTVEVMVRLRDGKIMSEQ